MGDGVVLSETTVGMVLAVAAATGNDSLRVLGQKKTDYQLYFLMHGIYNI